MPRASPGSSLSTTVATPSRRVRAPSWTSGIRPHCISTMRRLEEWALTAEEDHPLRRALASARYMLLAKRSPAPDTTKRILQRIVREKRTLLEMSGPILLDFCSTLVKEVASTLRVDLPSDDNELREVVDLALGRTRERWRRSTESLAAARMLRGRPRSLAIESLEILCEEIARSPLVGAPMKRRVQRVVVAWAAKATGSRPATLLRELQMQRRKSLRGR